AIGAVVLGVFSAFAVSFIPLRKIWKTKKANEKIKGIYSYSFPVLISIGGITLMYSIDIILAKRFFPAEIVGGYAVISMLSKIIFFATWPISKAMFPIASERYDKKNSSADIFKKSSLIVLFMSVLILFVYFLIPKSIIRILFGSQYISMASLLIYPAIAMAILSLTNIFVLYNLCVNRVKRNYLIVFFVALQIFLLSLFHSTILQFVSMLILCNLLLFVTMMILNFKK
ncbi:MAG TPA: oligosaccharide flippase family protein, partial [Candidatus Paceibacterota bacterium]|nr:oligosaccharide flippase family protein [Candidatus Paceibacterota bacterium]